MIDAMTLFDVEELTRYWIDHPPLHLVLGAYLRLGKQRDRRGLADPPSVVRRTAEAEQCLSGLGGALPYGDVHAGLNPVVLDFDELRRRSSSAINKTIGG